METSTINLSTTRHSLPINEIKVPPRMRKDLGSLDGLKDSIRRNGLIQPVVLDPNKSLVAGERRLRAHQQLGLERIDCVYVSELPEDVRDELEFEENFWRKSMTWQEEALGMLGIWRKKRLRGALEGFQENWQLTLSEMFGISIGNVNYILAVAKRLEQEQKLPEEQRRFCNFSSVAEAYRLGILTEREDRFNQDLSQQAKQTINTAQQAELQAVAKVELEEIKVIEATPDVLAAERERYQSNPLNVMPFEEYWAEKKAETESRVNTIFLGNVILRGDCIEHMLAHPGVYDHIITDPPYGIDMDNLNQQNEHGGLVDLDKLLDAHQVEENKELMAKFFPAAYVCTKDKAFVIVCGDIMLWQYMYDLATAAGFAVQRWPFIWRKVNQSVMNQCANFNVTKDFEIAMICHKQGATLATKRNTSIQDASNVEVKKTLGHPFGKPYELTKVFVEMVSMEGQSILEPFAGGGSMAIQILKMKRNVVAIEKEEHWYNSLLENVKREHYLKLNPKFVFA